MIRAAKLKDIDQIVELGLDALLADPIHGLIVDRQKVKEVATQCVSSTAHYAWVSEVDGKIVAAVCAVVSPLLFHRHTQADVVQFYTVEPGEGIKLIRNFLAWVKERKGIKLTTFTLERNADPRIKTLLDRLGLNEVMPMHIGVRK